MRSEQGQVGCLLSTLGLALGLPLLLVGVRVSANAGESAARRVGRLQLVAARKDAAAKRSEALKPLQERLRALQAETEVASRALAPVQARFTRRLRRQTALASQFERTSPGRGLTLASVQRADSLGQAIALTVAAKLSDKDQTQPRRGPAESPYPAGTPANAELARIYREHGMAPPEERARLSGELRGMREQQVAGVLASCAPLASGGRALTLTLSDQLSPRARELLLARLERLERLLDSGWVQARFLKKASYPEVLPVTPETLATALRSEYSGSSPLRSPEEIDAFYAEVFTYELENESPQTVEIQFSGQTLRLDPYLWGTFSFPPGRHSGTCRSLKSERVRPLTFELEGRAGDRLSSRLEIGRAPSPDSGDSAKPRK